MRVGMNRRRLLGWLGVVPAAAAGRPAAAGTAAPTGSSDALDVDLAGIAPGAGIEVQWHGRPVFIRRRSAAEIARERAVPLRELRDPQPDQARVQRPEWVVVEGVCTHGGCIPTGPLGDYGGWYCLCHGSQFDTAGRVRAGPARQNLEIPPYRFVEALRLRLGVR